MIKILLMLASLVPMIVHFPYLLQAWSGSRLDHWDWIFYLMALPAAAWAWSGSKRGKCDFWALIMLAGAAAAVFPALHHINALCIAASAGVVFAMVWLLYSWSMAYRVLPAAVILLLGTPSSSYQFSLLLMCPVYLAWAVKFVLAALCWLWIWGNKRWNWQISKGTLFFSAASLLTGLVLLHTKELYIEGKSFIPEFAAHCGDFWGRRLLPDENTKRFFATSKVEQFRYAGNNVDISVLAVRCGKNIHEIHPASHCLRTGMWTVHSEKVLYTADNFAVKEIDAQKGSNRILVWVWYSSERFSTPGFLAFRRQFKPDGNYYTYQISVPVYDNIEKSRALLHKFVSNLRMKKQ